MPDTVERAAAKSARRTAKERQRLADRQILGPVASRLTIASIIVAIASLCAVVPFILIAEVCRELLATTPDWNRVWTLLLTALGILGVRGLLQSGAMLWSHLIDAEHQYTLRQLLAAKLSRVPLGWFTERSSGEVKKLLQNDVDALHYLVAHARLEFVGALTLPLATFVYLLLVDWRLGLLLLVPIALYGFVMSRIMGPGYAAKLTTFESWRSRVSETTIEFVDGIQVVRAFGQPRKGHHRYQEAIDGYATFFTAWVGPITRLEGIGSQLLNPVVVLLLVLLAALGLIGGDAMEPSALVPFILLGLGIGSTVLTFGYGLQALRQASSASVRLLDLVETPELVDPAEGPVPVSGLVRFENVTFGYREGHPVLHGVDLELHPGTITALVGPSGSGKSTLARLVPRFYDVTGGRITLDGDDIRSLRSADLYRAVGFVLQDVQLIAETVRENLLLARPDADDAALERVCRAAQIHERILELPRGYDSEIGRDARLSGGEAQRLSIARALLADAPVLVLDEATAFADPESEAAIQDALAVLVADRTVLVIAHRLHTIIDVDQIVVLDDGRIVERGTPDELRSADGLFSRLWAANERALTEVDRLERTAETASVPTQNLEVRA
ncbi:ABC transporter ATP-binding protein [Microbacterium saperdae]|uniref:ATP-binding cassette subfamily B protein/ATP-binding cassette subfamily B protein IrtA n=1 Tax=Microbacterium saperdae TaxID=69368 RepID=A0A543BJ74_9MICO|nr:ABC transporter ATP-binding protein [Microbacterium saperdae]TQL84813.1 ATP-binding cassette subfamily B protein/ATP-binding cassette subfamily B protein IrtA [Microbacterium saperdae]GGM63870.1 ABC transporter ATP-binding protein [Microbacterium saperdae]